MTVPRAIGATALVGGGLGSLDSEYASTLADQYVAFVFAQGDAVYHYIADAGSGLDELSPDVIKPDYESAGVPYTGDLRWILHQAYPTGGTVPDGTNTGDIVRWNAVTGAWESSAEPFDFTQVNLTPQAAAVENTEGGVFYKTGDKQIYVCTEGE